MRRDRYACYGMSQCKTLCCTFSKTPTTKHSFKKIFDNPQSSNKFPSNLICPGYICTRHIDTWALENAEVCNNNSPPHHPPAPPFCRRRIILTRYVRTYKSISCPSRVVFEPPRRMMCMYVVSVFLARTP